MLAAAGCDTKSRVAAPTAPTKPPTPEERFERFISELRRRVEGGNDPNNYLSSSGTTYSGGYRIVDSSLIPPETPEGVYRATVEIEERASIMVIKIPEEDSEESETKEPDEAQGREYIDGAEDFLPEGAANAPNRPGLLAPSPIQTQDFNDSHTYHLAFVEGRWRLKTAIDKETFLAGAFEISLDRQ